MQDWLTIAMAIYVGLLPFQVVYGITKLFAGKDETPPLGCLLLVGVLLLLAIPLGWWTFHNFAVVWRP